LVLLLHGTYWSRVWQPVLDEIAAAGLLPVAVDFPGLRQAHREDRLCVPEETHLRTLQDNELAESRRNPAGGLLHGPDMCRVGFVWRGAFPAIACAALRVKR